MTEPPNAYGVVLPHIRVWRMSRALTQLELAKAAGVSRATVVRAESGGTISMENIRKIAGVLGVSAEDLIYRTPGA